MNNRSPRRRSPAPIYSFAVAWVILSIILPLYRLWALICTCALCAGAAYLVGKREAQKEAARDAERRKAAEEEARRNPPKKSYGPKIDPIVQEGETAMREMDRLYASIRDPAVRSKIARIKDITGKIVQDAIDDPSDVPQIKKFMSYYLPTTIKLLNTYDRMGQQGIEGDNITKTMGSINEMLDTAIQAYEKRLDALFADQSLDIETDISVMNTMLEREGLGETGAFRKS